jgi:predicted MFS family arabinose efflux permease
MARPEHPRSWSVELAGFSSFFVGIGLARFGYPPLIPVLIQSGALTLGAAGYVAGANFAGYLAGASLAECSAARFGTTVVITIALAGCVLSFGLSALDLGLAWLMGWRVVAGLGGGLVMVAGAPLLLAAVPPARRGRAGGRFFAGVGSGMLASGLVLRLLPGAGAAWLWLALAAIAVLAAAVAVAFLPRHDPLPPSGGVRLGSGWADLGFPFWGLAVAYAAVAIGYVPHTVFWVDFLARAAGAGLGLGGLAWMLFGLGALTGSQLFGLLADRIGFAASLRLAILGLALALTIPLIVTSAPLLIASSLLAGGCALGSASLAAGRSSELLAPDMRRRAWAILTVIFALAQWGGAWLLSALLQRTQSYPALFIAAAVILALGLIVEAAMSRAAR